jgi:hypothetical protein
MTTVSKEDLARALSAELGVPLDEARAEVADSLSTPNPYRFAPRAHARS